MNRPWLAALSLLVASACAAPGDPLDGAHDDFGTGKADSAISASSPEAAAVLALVNDSDVTLEVLDEDVPLHATAAAGIFAGRPFATLEELDAVPYVGPVALDRLLAYATANGYLGAELPDAIHWVRNAAEYRAAATGIYRAARARIDALHATGQLPGDWAVALDADETVLSNALYQREQALSGRGHNYFDWLRWVARHEATAVPGARVFLDRVAELGGHIAIVTNRGANQCDDTRANLTRESLPFDIVLCRTGSGEKEARWDSLADGTASPDLPPVEIVMWVGDNIKDFPTLTQGVRYEDDGAFEDFGARYFVIPNPMYGSWTGNDRD